MTLIDEIRIHPEEGAKRLESECKPGLQALARRLCSDEGDAEELVNRTLAEAVAHIDSLISRPALFGWMCQILVDCHAKDNRRKSRSAEAPDNETVAAAVDEDAEARLFREVDAGILRDAIETLPDDIRKTVVMHYFMGVPVREAAKVLSVPTGTVAWRLHYARMLLAAKLGAAAKKPGGKALLVALVLAALTAVGATVATLVGEAAIGSRPQPAAEGSREPPAIGGRPQPAAESGRELSASGSRLQSATGCRLLSASDTATSPMTGDTMNTTKTTSTLAAAALALTSGFAPADAPAETAALPAGITITISNFDEDLATVYVNGTAATNGETRVLADGESLTLELRDFRSDWYFAYAPDSQTDRTLALESWGGLPDGVDATANPVTFTPAGDLTVTPNVDCKGHVWHAVGTTAISNAFWTSSANTFTASTRSLQVSGIVASRVPDGYTGEAVMDWATRVRVDGVNYTVTAFRADSQPFANARATAFRVPRRLGSINSPNFGRSANSVTNAIGLPDTGVVELKMYAFMAGSSFFGKFQGPITNYLPRGLQIVGVAAFSGQSDLTGPVVLPCATTIKNAFINCSGLTELLCESPNLTEIAANAFQNTVALKKVTLASPVLSDVAVNAFNKPITNLTWRSAPPASQTPVDNLLTPVAAADGAHALHVYLPLCTEGWWAWVTPPTEAELAAGPPDGCVGVYVTESGARKGWIIPTDDIDASLLVTDQNGVDAADYEIFPGLVAGDTFTLSRAGYTSCELQRFNRATGLWTSIRTVEGSSFEYSHDGHLTRAIWKVDGVRLDAGVACYGGSVTISGDAPITGDIYARNAVVTLTATPRTEHPTSHFVRWDGLEGDAALSPTVQLTLAGATTAKAVFAPDEWFYDASTKLITDGEYTSSAAVTPDRTAKTVSVPFCSGGKDNTLLLDFSLPVLVEDDPDADYAITAYKATYDNRTRRIRIGPSFSSFATSAFDGNTVLESFEGLGSSSVTQIPGYFLRMGGAAAPITQVNCEANEFVPANVKAIARYGFHTSYNLVGTLTLAKLDGFDVLGQPGGQIFTPAQTSGITNLVLSCETLSTLAGNVFGTVFPSLEELTIGSTNLTACYAGQFQQCARVIRRVRFLAHAPAATALDNLLTPYRGYASGLAVYADRTTSGSDPLLIHCSKYAPGWRELAAAVDRSSEEWRARPAGTWGVYQTAAGGRFYLVQCDSKYDKNPFTLIIMR